MISFPIRLCLERYTGWSIALPLYHFRQAQPAKKYLFSCSASTTMQIEPGNHCIFQFFIY